MKGKFTKKENFPSNDENEWKNPGKKVLVAIICFLRRNNKKNTHTIFPPPPPLSISNRSPSNQHRLNGENYFIQFSPQENEKEKKKTHHHHKKRIRKEKLFIRKEKV